MTAAISAVVFSAIFNSEPIRLQAASLIDNQKPVVIVGQTEVVASDLIIIVPMISAIFGFSYSISTSIVKK